LQTIREDDAKKLFPPQLTKKQKQQKCLAKKPADAVSALELGF